LEEKKARTKEDYARASIGRDGRNGRVDKKVRNEIFIEKRWKNVCAFLNVDTFRKKDT
jgi:hypothetical protein